MRFFQFLLVVTLWVGVSDAWAATRTAYFTAVGRNEVIYGIGDAATSRCTVTITNNSSVNQTVSLNLTYTSSGTASNGASLATAGSANNVDLSVNAGATRSHTVSYTAFPTSVSGCRPTGTPCVTGTQEVICQGTITATDATGNNGFVIATGTLVTFVESGRMTTLTATGQSYFGTQAVYTQTPIFINRGKPF